MSQTRQPDPTKLNALIGKMLGDLGGAFSLPTVRLGFRLGLFDALHAAGPSTSNELAERAGGLCERYVREWALACRSDKGQNCIRKPATPVTKADTERSIETRASKLATGRGHFDDRICHA